MKKIMITVLAVGMFIVVPGTILAAGEKSLSKSSQLDIQDCKERIILLKEKVESLEMVLQKKTCQNPHSKNPVLHIKSTDITENIMTIHLMP